DHLRRDGIAKTALPCHTTLGRGAGSGGRGVNPAPKWATGLLIGPVIRHHGGIGDDQQCPQPPPRGPSRPSKPSSPSTGASAAHTKTGKTAPSRSLVLVQPRPQGEEGTPDPAEPLAGGKAGARSGRGSALPPYPLRRGSNRFRA